MAFDLGIADSMLPVLIVIGAVVLVPLFALIIMYNRLVNLRQLCNESFSNIDTELQRRHDLIPNLVSIVKGYAKHERELFERVAEVRSRAVDAVSRLTRQGRGAFATQGEVVGHERELGRLLGDVMVVVEKYPDIKADENFRQLMTELRNTEDRIQAARRFFNGNIRDYNNRCQQFPSNLVAGMFSFAPREFFDIDNPLARANVNVGEAGL